MPHKVQVACRCVIGVLTRYNNHEIKKISPLKCYVQNGSLFQVTFTAQETLDERCVVFGCLCTEDSYSVLEDLSYFGTKWGQPTEELTISDCNVVYPEGA